MEKKINRGVIRTGETDITEGYKKMMQGATMRMYSRHGRGFFRKMGR